MACGVVPAANEVTISSGTKGWPPCADVAPPPLPPPPARSSAADNAAADDAATDGAAAHDRRMPRRPTASAGRRRPTNLPPPGGGTRRQPAAPSSAGRSRPSGRNRMPRMASIRRCSKPAATRRRGAAPRGAGSSSFTIYRPQLRKTLSHGTLPIWRRSKGERRGRKGKPAQSVMAMKATTLSFCSEATMRATSVLASLVEATRT